MDDIARYGAYLANEKNASQNTIYLLIRVFGSGFYFPNF